VLDVVIPQETVEPEEVVTDKCGIEETCHKRLVLSKIAHGPILRLA